ncbi:YciI family protein [Roseomonas sp. CCTCC AB2023176]|uniref:YciI family protein n=1 Tax=Roseomonas sp. CCTCC AB2023176 TaxID=3342640 RepID=UPI0035D83357
MTDLLAVIARAAPDAADRIGALRPAHLGVLTPLVEAGTVRLAVPLLDDAGSYRGSLIVIEPGAVEGYFAAEPFRAIWVSHEVRPFRLAGLPWPPLPTGPVPPAPTHVVLLAGDGADAEAPARRMGARPRHFARVERSAADGMLALGGAFLDAPGGAMVGSLAVTRHGSIGEAQAWWAEDPYLAEGVWRDTEWFATRFAPLPYRPLA